MGLSSRNQSGFALVVTLLLLSVLMLMAAGVAYIGSINVDLSNAVGNKPQSIKAAETCVDEAIDWLYTADGIAWVTGAGLPIDLAAAPNGPLYQKSLMTDTVPSGSSDLRTNQFKNSVGRGNFKSCLIQKLAATNVTGVGAEIGTQIDGAVNLVYTISITADGNFNVFYNSDGTINKNNWNSDSSRSLLEVVLDYIP
jgi:hypothetical protein